MALRGAPAWTGIVMGLLAGLLVGSIWLMSQMWEGFGNSNGAGAANRGNGSASQISTVLDSLVNSGSSSNGLSLECLRRNAIVLATDLISPAVVSINVIDHRTYTRAVVPRDMAFLEQAFPGFFPRREFQQDVQNLGSGFIVSRDGFIISNYHVIAGADEIVVTLSDGRQMTGVVRDSIPDFDLALLQIEGDDLPVAPLSTEDDLLIGEWAVAIGSPFGFLLADSQPSVTVGVISATNRDIKRSDEERWYLGMIQTDAAINPGNSGGPLINSCGEVVGVNTFIFSKSGGSVGIGFAVPIRRVRILLEEVREFGRYRQRYVGLRFQRLSPHMAMQLGLDDATGYLVLDVRPDSPADVAGLQPYDILRSINGVPLRSDDTVIRLFYEARVGTRLEFSAEREGESYTGAMILAEAPN